MPSLEVSELVCVVIGSPVSAYGSYIREKVDPFSLLEFFSNEGSSSRLHIGICLITSRLVLHKGFETSERRI